MITMIFFFNNQNLLLSKTYKVGSIDSALMLEGKSHSFLTETLRLTTAGTLAYLTVTDINRKDR